MLVHHCPWWVSVILAGAVYGSMRFLAPGLMQENKVLAPIMQALPQVAGLGALICLSLALLSLIRQISERIATKRRLSGAHKSVAVIENQSLVACPDCGSAMITRTAKVGPVPGSQFLGCSNFPKCRGTRNL